MDECQLVDFTRYAENFRGFVERGFFGGIDVGHMVGNRLCSSVVICCAAIVDVCRLLLVVLTICDGVLREMIGGLLVSTYC
jgi:hypothetical protein